MARMISVSKEVDIEVDAEDLDTDDLLAELQNRGISGSPEHLYQQRQAMLMALWANDNDRAIELLKNYLCDCLGRAAV